MVLAHMSYPEFFAPNSPSGDLAAGQNRATWVFPTPNEQTGPYQGGAISR